MLFDRENVYSWEQALTATADSTDIIDHGDKGDVGKEEGRVEVVAQVVEDFADGTSVAVSLKTSENENKSSPTTLVSTPAIPVASLKAGYQFAISSLPHQFQRYTWLTYTVVGTPTAGKVTSGLVGARQTNN